MRRRGEDGQPAETRLEIGETLRMLAFVDEPIDRPEKCKDEVNGAPFL